MTRLPDHEVDRIIGQTPCLCGDCETWHPQCYRDKSIEQIEAEYRVAYRKARAWIKTRAALLSLKAIGKAATRS